MVKIRNIGAMSGLIILAMGLVAQQEEPLLENVVVRNVEVPVRVMDENNLPVTDLTKEDFEVFENGKPVKINGFYLKRKQIVAPVQAAEILPLQEKKIPRTFVLAFQLTSYTDEVVKALDHLFTSVFTTGDRIIVFTAHKAFELRSYGSDQSAVFKQTVIADITKECLKETAALDALLRKLNHYANLYKSVNPGMNYVDFLGEYLRTWAQYREKYLTPDSGTFFRLSQFLKNIKGNKWVLNFYQFPNFPKLRRNSVWASGILTHGPENFKAQEYINAFSVTLEEYPIDAISKAFCNVDTTVHNFFLRRSITSFDEDLEYERVASSTENMLSAICKLTGGQNLASNNLVESLHKIEEIEDAYYMLTYAPPAGKVGKLKIKVKRDYVKLFYDDQFRADYIKPLLQRIDSEFKQSHLQVDGLVMALPKISFGVKGISLPEEGGKMMLSVRVLAGESFECYKQEKVLDVQKESISISLDLLKGLSPGQYRLVIEALDTNNQQKDTLYQSFTVK